jgi:hypothetical protein
MGLQNVEAMSLWQYRQSVDGWNAAHSTGKARPPTQEEHERRVFESALRELRSKERNGD